WTAGYTWAKAMALNYNGAWLDTASGVRWYEKNTLKGPTQYDRTHTFYSSAIWELPVFRNSTGFAHKLLGGWEVANIVTATSGLTFPVNIGIDLWDLGPNRRNIFPNRIASGELSKDVRTVDRWFDLSAFPLTTVPSGGNSAARPLRGAPVPL